MAAGFHRRHSRRVASGDRDIMEPSIDKFMTAFPYANRREQDAAAVERTVEAES